MVTNTKAYRFSFKSEAIWTIIFAVAPVAAGSLVLLIFWFVRWS